MPKITRTEYVSFIIGVIQPAVTLIGVLLNAVFFAAVYHEKSLHTATFTYLAHLAFADVFYLVYTCFISLVQRLSTPLYEDLSYLGRFQCMPHRFLQLFSYFASMFIVTLVTFERFLAICHPFKHKAIASKTRTIKLLVLCWAIAAVLSFIMAFDKYYYVIYCQSYPQDMNSFLNFWQIVHR